MSGKSLLYTAAVSLAVVVAFNHLQANGASALKPRIGN
jgi:hypothetical protein